jgi:hypothetical protein
VAAHRGVLGGVGVYRGVGGTLGGLLGVGLGGGGGGGEGEQRRKEAK